MTDPYRKRGSNAELEERRARLARTKERIQDLVHFIEAGNAFEGVTSAINGSTGGAAR